MDLLQADGCELNPLPVSSMYPFTRAYTPHVHIITYCLHIIDINISTVNTTCMHLVVIEYTPPHLVCIRNPLPVRLQSFEPRGIELPVPHCPGKLESLLLLPFESPPDLLLCLSLQQCECLLLVGDLITTTAK